MRLGLWASLGVIAACKSRNAEPATDAAVDAAVEAPAVVVAVDATAAPAPSPWVDLLHAAPAEVAVSSTVQNPRDKPMHLVDGSLATAWNSKTGDLAGAWIGFRVPEDARVDHLELTAGYDRDTPGGDLFLENHRIRRLFVTRMTRGNWCAPEDRDGPRLGTYDLEPSQRGLQRVPFAGPGGSYCVWISETTPGTKADWRELVISEFRVLGKPGAALRDARDPLEVDVGTLRAPLGDGAPPTFKDGDESTIEVLDPELPLARTPEASLATLCQRYVAAWTAAASASLRDGNHYPGEPSQVSCKEIALDAPAKVGAPFKSVRELDVRSGWVARRQLVVELAEGFLLTPIVLQEADLVERDTRVQWEPTAVESIYVEAGNVVVVRDWMHVSSSPIEYRVLPYIARGASFCGYVKGVLACSELSPAYAPPLALKTPTRADMTAADMTALPWRGEVTFHVGAGGKLSVSPASPPK